MLNVSPFVYNNISALIIYFRALRNSYYSRMMNMNKASGKLLKRAKSDKQMIKDLMKNKAILIANDYMIMNQKREEAKRLTAKFNKSIAAQRKLLRSYLEINAM